MTGDAVTVRPREQVRRRSNGATGVVIRRETAVDGRDYVRFDGGCHAYIDRDDLEPLDVTVIDCPSLNGPSTPETRAALAEIGRAVAAWVPA